MSVVMQILGLADGRQTPFDGEFVKDYDPNGEGGTGSLVTTPEKAEALKFPDATEAMQTWKLQSDLVPLRPDGKPNRPLTAFTVEIADAND